MSLAPQSLISGWHVIIFSNAPWVLPGSSALHCKCLALVLSLALKHSWFTYSLFIAFWALSPGSSALGWTGFSCSSWNIVMYLSAGRLHLQWAGLTWCGLEKKNENMLHAFDSFLREKAATSRNASCIGSGFLMSGSTSACAQKNWLGPETIQQRLYSHCEIHHCLVPVSEQSCKPTDFLPVNQKQPHLQLVAAKRIKVNNVK